MCFHFCKRFFAPIVATLLFLEFILRAGGVAPAGLRREMLFVSDSEVGWRLPPGSHAAQVGSSGWQFSYTVLADGTRKVPCEGCSAAAAARGRVVIIGDSVSWGWGLSDSETPAAQLVKILPGENVVNAAVPGFGVLQSVLHLKQLQQDSMTGISDIVLGVAGYMTQRDSADLSWTVSLAIASGSLNFFAPFLGISSTGSAEVVPAGPLFGEWPLRDTLSAIFLGEVIAEVPAALRRRMHATELESHAFRMLAAQARVAAARVTLFTWMEDPDYIERFSSLWSELGFSFLDCKHPLVTKPEGRIPGDGHPNAEVSRAVANCVGAGLLKNREGIIAPQAPLKAG